MRIFSSFFFVSFFAPSRRVVIVFSEGLREILIVHWKVWVVLAARETAKSE